MFARRDRERDTAKNQRRAKNFHPAHFCSKPQPLRRGGEWRGQAMHEQNGETRAEPWQRLIQRDVAEAETQRAAEKKHWKCFAQSSLTQRVSPQCEQTRREHHT